MPDKPRVSTLKKIAKAWPFILIGIVVASFGVWQGWTMRDQPDLGFLVIAAGFGAGFYIIGIGWNYLYPGGKS